MSLKLVFLLPGTSLSKPWLDGLNDTMIDQQCHERLQGPQFCGTLQVLWFWWFGIPQNILGLGEEVIGGELHKQTVGGGPSIPPLCYIPEILN